MRREYLTILVGNSISRAIRRAFVAWRSLYTGRGVKKQGKTPLYRRRSVMRLSTKGRYAVMAMADLAGQRRRQQAESTPVALADIAARQDISLSYLEQLFAKLRRGGLVTSVRGPGGGYRLSRPVRRTAHRRHHRGGGRAHRRHPLQDRQHQGLHQDRRALRHPRSVGRAGPADPCLPVVGFAGRCGGAPGAGPRQALQ